MFDITAMIYGVDLMAREKFQTLTEQMYYILLCLQEEHYGADVAELVRQWTNGSVVIGPGTMYGLLETFQTEGLICLTKTEGRRRSYRITDKGNAMLEAEYQRLRRLTEDYRRYGPKTDN